MQSQHSPLKQLDRQAAAMELIRAFEGFSPIPYMDAAGVWTVGIGHAMRGSDGRLLRGEKDRATAEASKFVDFDILLGLDCRHAARSVNTQLAEQALNELTPYQLAALDSFVFNFGSGNFGISKLRRVINEGAYDKAPEQFMRWVFADGRKLKGLIRRRNAEITLWRRHYEQHAETEGRSIRA